MIIPKIVSIKEDMLNNPSPIPVKQAATTNTGNIDAEVNGIRVIASPFIILVANLIGTLTSSSITSVTPQYPV